ncbi:pilus assembly protein PilM [bacterium]|nr:pilus assembly protein PilM [bacterium]
MLGIGSKLRVGLDIGSHSIKVVVVEKSGSKYRVVHRGMRPIYSGTQKYDLDGAKRSQIVPILLDLFKQFKLQPKKLKNVRTIVTGPQVAAKEIVALPLEKTEMDSAMMLEARKHIPLDGSDTQVDYQVLGENIKEPDKVNVLVVATTKKLFSGHIDTLREIEMRPIVVDIEPLAMVNSYLAFNDPPEDGVVVLLNVGCRKTGISIFGRRDMFFSREIPVAGAAFTEELMKDYGLDYQEAERVKSEQGLSPDLPEVGDKEGGLRLAKKSVIERFGDEVNRTLRYYVKETSQSFFTRFIVTGGSAGLSEIPDYLSKKFNASVEVFDPFARMEVAAGNGDGIPSQYAAAAGLAIRED